MDAWCGRHVDDAPEATSCLCRPSFRFTGIRLEHGTLGVLQLLKAAYVLAWLQVRRRGVFLPAKSSEDSLMVLPVYARFLTFEAWSCVVWGIFYLGQSVVDQNEAEMPRAASTVLQLTRYLSTFTWAWCSDGVSSTPTLRSDMTNDP